ncbi:hypothetical protein Stok01_02654 [Sulfurisphaera tokodaii]
MLKKFIFVKLDCKSYRHGILLSKPKGIQQAKVRRVIHDVNYSPF